MTLILRAIYSTAIVLILIGFAGCTGLLIQTLHGNLSDMPLAFFGLVLMGAIFFAGMKIRAVLPFLVFVLSCWVGSRLAIVFLFPNFVLVGDEHYFHQFVSKLVGAMAAGNIASLSTIYDFPVWLSRSFPFYLPLAQFLGADDVWAARILNVLLGAAQAILVFLIARRLLSLRAAKLCTLLLLIFPYHCVNVLSYDPQIAGTFFLLAAIWLFLALNQRDRRSKAVLAILSVALGMALLLAGIQRGGIDLLAAAVMLLALVCQRVLQKRKTPVSHLVACWIAIFVVWLPMRTGFNDWVAAQDRYSLRSHTLGFMTRGWNLVTSGEYLPLYEQLDVSAAKAEKQRTLEAILITEFARQPMRSLLILPPVKVAKFFALGHASTAEQGLIEGGYRKAALVYQCLSALFAPLVMGLCLLGLLRCWQSPGLQSQLLIPVLLIVMSCLAIVLIWETSPRYSHPIQFALLILATVGAVAFRRSWIPIRIRPGAMWKLALSAVALGGCWLLVGACVAGVARSDTGDQFLDPRSIAVRNGESALAVEALHPFSQSWEGAIHLTSGTPLPAKLELSLPAPKVGSWDHWSLTFWLPDNSSADAGVSQIVCQSGNGSVTIPAASSGKIARVAVSRQQNQAAVSILIVPSNGQSRLQSDLRLGIGYALLN